MKIPETTFVWTVDSEVDRLIHTASHIANGFFQKENIPVLPTLTKLQEQIVVFPDLDYGKISDFWTQSLEQVDIVSPVLSDVFRNEVKQIIADKVFIDEALIDRKEQLWNETSKDFFDLYYHMFPHALKLIRDIEIRITSIGTSVSWSLPQEEENQKIIVYLRADISVDHIAEALLTVVNRLPGWDENSSWRESEYFIDHIMIQTAFSAMFPDFVPTLPSFEETNKMYKDASIRYLSLLGFSTQTKVIRFVEDNIYMNEENITKTFTKREGELLKVFVEKSESLVTYDQIASMLWSDNDEKFSLWALNKAVGRLRNKLIKNGMSENCISPLYGKGYLYWK